MLFVVDPFDHKYVPISDVDNDAVSPGHNDVGPFTINVDVGNGLTIVVTDVETLPHKLEIVTV